jgi:flagellar L-ring protein precursor FlgH
VLTHRVSSKWNCNNMKTCFSILSCLLVLLLVGCNVRQAPIAATEHQLAPPIAGPPPTPATNGSLWTEAQGSLFYDLKARRVGDILTVAIYEQASASKEASTSSGRESSASADITKFLGLEQDIANIREGIDPTDLVSANFANDFKGSGKTSRKEDLVATLTTRVVEVFPNGNLRIAGSKTVTVNNEDQIIRLSGIIRPADISQANVVDSKHILDADIEYTGNGIISDKQRPGWMVRVLDNVWPF